MMRTTQLPSATTVMAFKPSRATAAQTWNRAIIVDRLLSGKSITRSAVQRIRALVGGPLRPESTGSTTN